MELARRINQAFGLLQKEQPQLQVTEHLMKKYGVSQIQAYRSASQRDKRKTSYTGSICGIYRQNTCKPDSQNKKVGKLQRNFYEQSSECSAGRFFSKVRSWPKKRGKLKYYSPRIECGSKSSLRFTIFSFQPITRLSKVHLCPKRRIGI